MRSINRHLRRFVTPLVLTVIAATSVLLAAGCGGGESKTPFGQALSYVPKGAPMVIALDSDIEGSQYKNIKALVDRVPSGKEGSEKLLKQALDKIEATDVDFEKEIKPLLGNKVVIAAPSVDSFEDDGNAIFTGVVKDEKLLNSLLKKDELKLKKSDDYKDVQIYREKDGDSVLGVNGAEIVASDSLELVKKAIDTAKSDSSFSEDSFKDAQPGSGSKYLMALYVDIKTLLDDSSKARSVATKVPWVGALTTAGMTVSTNQDGFALNYKVDTSGGELKEDDLPLAPGAEGPKLEEFKTGSTGSSGIRDLARTIRFIEKVAREIDPATGPQIDRAKEQVKSGIGIDLDRDLVDQLEGDLQFISSTSGGGVILDLTDAARMEQTLQQLRPLITGFLSGAGLRNPKIDESKEGESTIYSISDGDKEIVEFGVVSGKLQVAVPPTKIDDLRPDNLKAVETVGPGSLVSVGDVKSSLQQVQKQVQKYLESQNPLAGQNPLMGKNPLGSDHADAFSAQLFNKVIDEIDRSFKTIEVSSSTETSTDAVEGEFKLTAK